MTDQNPFNDKQIVEALTTLGLSSNEHEVFCFLFFDIPQGAGVSFIAFKLETPRSTIYAVLNSLIKKGIVRKEMIDSSPRFIIDRKQISEYVDSRCNALQNSKDIIFNKSTKLS